MKKVLSIAVFVGLVGFSGPMQGAQVDRGAKPEAVMPEQWQKLNDQLVEAVQEGESERVAKLLAQGANPNATEGNWGTTPLIAAACSDSGDIVAQLLQAGADVFARDNAGDSVLINSIKLLERRSWEAVWPLLVRAILTSGQSEEVIENELNAAVSKAKEGGSRPLIVEALRNKIAEFKKYHGMAPFEYALAVYVDDGNDSRLLSLLRRMAEVRTIMGSKKLADPATIVSEYMVGEMSSKENKLLLAKAFKKAQHVGNKELAAAFIGAYGEKEMARLMKWYDSHLIKEFAGQEKAEQVEYALSVYVQTGNDSLLLSLLRRMAEVRTIMGSKKLADPATIVSEYMGGEMSSEGNKLLLAKAFEKAQQDPPLRNKELAAAFIGAYGEKEMASLIEWYHAHSKEFAAQEKAEQGAKQKAAQEAAPASSLYPTLFLKYDRSTAKAIDDIPIIPPEEYPGAADVANVDVEVD